MSVDKENALENDEKSEFNVLCYYNHNYSLYLSIIDNDLYSYLYSIDYNHNYYIEFRFSVACVFGEMRTLKTGWRWGAQKPACLGRFPGIAGHLGVISAGPPGECPSYPLCRVQPIVFHQSRAPLYSPSRDDPCTAVCHSPPRPHIVSLSHYLVRLALTLSRSISFSH